MTCRITSAGHVKIVGKSSNLFVWAADSPGESTAAAITATTFGLCGGICSIFVCKWNSLFSRFSSALIGLEEVLFLLLGLKDAKLS